MSTYHQELQRVNTRDTGLYHQCKPSSVLGMLQDAATRAAIAIHVSHRETMERYGAFWMLARTWYKLEVPIYGNDEITIKTWHRGNPGMSTYRDFDIYRNGVQIGEAVSIWVLATAQERKLLRMSTIPEMEQTSGGELNKDMVLHKLRMPKEMAQGDVRTFHYSDIDVNGHVNNAKYADYICDALHLERLGQGKFVSSMQMGYLAECRPDETVTLYTGQVGEQWYGAGRDQDGKSRFEGCLTLSEYS